ncbi:uncharacterized protein [Physcomitrium patens]|uniref:uncharacterized protein n=1 Tax=Physcomitrium patens TaxID=3218 RepID=UPI003CCD1D09
MRSVARKRGGESKRNSRGSRIRRHEAAGPNCGGGEQEAKPAEAGLSGNATPCGGGEARALRSLVQHGHARPRETQLDPIGSNAEPGNLLNGPLLRHNTLFVAEFLMSSLAFVQVLLSYFSLNPNRTVFQFLRDDVVRGVWFACSFAIRGVLSSELASLDSVFEFTDVIGM